MAGLSPKNQKDICLAYSTLSEKMLEENNPYYKEDNNENENENENESKDENALVTLDDSEMKIGFSISASTSTTASSSSLPSSSSQISSSLSLLASSSPLVSDAPAFNLNPTTISTPKNTSNCIPANNPCPIPTPVVLASPAPIYRKLAQNQERYVPNSSIRTLFLQERPVNRSNKKRKLNPFLFEKQLPLNSMNESRTLPHTKTEITTTTTTTTTNIISSPCLSVLDNGSHLLHKENQSEKKKEDENEKKEKNSLLESNVNLSPLDVVNKIKSMKVDTIITLSEEDLSDLKNILEDMKKFCQKFETILQQMNSK